ncbi:unnamed protein product [Calicophoron daubneyi]|uniref:Hexosyltransferase n=1 Tax=Calicophoron daubneyi TaxID=300641 RepID=A0AAV2TS55_CALDB
MCYILEATIGLRRRTYLNKVSLPIYGNDLFLVHMKTWPVKIQQKFELHRKNGTISLAELKKIYASCADGLHPNLLNPENGRFLISQDTFCEDRPELKILLVVHSNCKNRHRRELIRTTWGSLKRVGSQRIATLFFVGRTKHAEDDELLSEESEKYRDIIQRDFIEDYHNMTRKHLTVMEWLSSGNCKSVKNIVKVDDDTFVDVFHLVRFLSSSDMKLDKGFYCSATTGAKPSRPGTSKSSKWEISKSEFVGKEFPTYCEGLGYVLNAELVPQLYWCSVFSRPIWIDDVYVTGVLADKLKIRRQEFIPGHSYRRVGPASLNENILDSIFLTSYYSEYLPGLFKRLWQAAVSNSMNRV